MLGTGRVGCTHTFDVLWKTVFDCTGSWLIRELIAEDTSLIGRDYLIEHASPANFAGDQGHGEIHQVEKRDEDAEDDIDPRLAHDLRACCSQGFRDCYEAQCSAYRGKKQWQERQGGELQSRKRSQHVAESEQSAQD